MVHIRGRGGGRESAVVGKKYCTNTVVGTDDDARENYETERSGPLSSDNGFRRQEEYNHAVVEMIILSSN